MDIYIARQPVFNKKRHTWAYRLKFHPELEPTYFKQNNGDSASLVLSNGFLSLKHDSILRDKLGIITFNKELLLKEIPLLFPKNILAIEIDKSVAPDEMVATILTQLQLDGYKLIFDGDILLQNIEPYIELANMVKIDFSNISVDELKIILPHIEKDEISFIAESINNQEQFEQAEKLGFKYFSGNFFCEPEIIAGKGIPSRQLVHLQLLSEINRPNLSRKDLENIFKRDVALSFKLLNYINSAHFSIRNQIRSLNHALSLLGLDEAKRLLSLIILGNLVNNKSEELLVTSIVRANLAERVGGKLGLEEQQSELFLMGMFSVLDALLDYPLPEILKDLPIADEIKNALLGEPGLYKDVYDLVLYAEHGEWPDIFNLVEKLHIKKYEFLDLSLQAIKEANPLILQ